MSSQIDAFQHGRSIQFRQEPFSRQPMRTIRQIETDHTGSATNLAHKGPQPVFCHALWNNQRCKELWCVCQHDRLEVSRCVSQLDCLGCGQKGEHTALHKSLLNRNWPSRVSAGGDGGGGHAATIIVVAVVHVVMMVMSHHHGYSRTPA